MKIRLLLFSFAFAAVSVALSFCSKEQTPVQKAAQDLEQSTTDRAACSVTVTVTAGGPITVCGTQVAGTGTCATTTNPPVNLTGIDVATLGVPKTYTVTSPTYMKLTGPNAPAGPSTVSISSGANNISVNLNALESKDIAIGPNCNVGNVLH